MDRRHGVITDAGGDALRALNEASRAIWDENAPFWDDRMGDSGNDFHRELVAPAAARLLAVHPGETVLEVGCGTGLFARQLAQAGARVVATDFSAVFMERAKQRTREYAEQIELRLVDATDEAQLLALGEHRFECAVSNMALMDIATIDPMLSALSSLLKPGGRFVFTVMHPCFNNSGCARVVEETDQDGEIVITYALKVHRYLSAEPARGIGVRGQPAAQFYFHRPISVLFNACFRAGFVLDGVEEPGFEHARDHARDLNAANFAEIPFVLAARVRLP
jgi:2-polyprenyl-3-methyl-5-hydroxy-6-metoxy-1,4-benzoquinol methylase